MSADEVEVDVHVALPAAQDDVAERHSRHRQRLTVACHRHGVVERGRGLSGQGDHPPPVGRRRRRHAAGRVEGNDDGRRRCSSTKDARGLTSLEDHVGGEHLGDGESERGRETACREDEKEGCEAERKGPHVKRGSGTAIGEEDVDGCHTRPRNERGSS